MSPIPRLRLTTSSVFRLLRVAAFAVLPCVASSQTGRTVLPQAKAVAAAGVDVGAVPDSQAVPSIVVTLKRMAAQQADLDTFLHDVRTAGTNAYHQWLTPSSFAARFAPSGDSVAQVTAWLQSQGLQVKAMDAGGMRLSVSGTAAQADSAFGVSLHRMSTPLGYAISVQGSVSVPNSLSPVVQSVSGLDATAASQSSLSTLADAVDANGSAVLTADLTQSAVSSEELNTVLEQAAAQGQTVVLTHVAAGLLPSRALLMVAAGSAAADTTADATPRPDWQAATGLPGNNLRATPDAAAVDVSALAAGLASVVTTSGRQGEIAARFYAVAPEPGVFTHADTSVTDGTWAAADGLGTVDVAKLVKALATGSTTPQSSTIALSSQVLTHGQNITLTATITGGSGTPTGTVTFGSSQGGTLGSAALTNGVATYTTNTLAGGLYGFFGTYNGDSTYSTSTTNVDTATVQPEAAKLSAYAQTSGLQNGITVGMKMGILVEADSASQVGAPSGTVTVYPYGTLIGQQTYTGTLQGGCYGSSWAACVNVGLPATNAGTFTFQANCTTNASFSCYAPVSFTVTVGKGTPAFTLTQSGTAASATLTANVTVPTGADPSVAVPTGTVQFLDGTTVLGSGTLNSSGVATYTGALGTGTTHTLTANYAGDGNYTTATASASTTTKVTPTVVLAIMTAGTSLSATVTPPSGTTTVPTGTVQFLDGTTAIGTATLNASGVATYTGGYTSGTGHIFTAVYAGDTNFNTATSNAIDSSKVTPTVTLTMTGTPSATNTVSLSAAVTSTSSTTATGTVSFLDGTTQIGTGTLNASGVAMFSGALAANAQVRPFASGTTVTHTLTAVYAGDTNFNTATSNAVTANTTTTLISTTTALTSASGYSGAYGTSFTMNVVVTPASYVSSGTSPSGAVTLSDATGVVGTGTLSGGSASIVLSTLSVGTHSLTATYAGDTNYATSTSSTPLVITITPVTATLTATISPTGSIPYGYNANVNVSATATGSAAATGTVTATISGNNGTYTGTLTATATGANTSTASISVPVPPPGTYTITITCNTNITCNTTTVSLTTVQGNTKTTITGLTPSSPQAGVPVSISATVANSGTGTGTYTYTGTVSFYAGSKFLATGTVANGIATGTVTFLSATATSVTAVYSGDTNWTGSTSAVYTVTPSPISTAIALTPSTTNGIVGQNITLTATVSSGVTGATLVPTGTVAFYDTFNGIIVNLGSAALASNGLNTAYASLSTTGLRAGTHNIAAIYSGDTVFLTQTTSSTAVNIGDFTLSFVPSALTMTQGTSATATVVVSGVNSFSGTIALGCTPPSGTETTCSVSPSSVATGSSVALTITTTKTVAALHLPQDRRMKFAVAASALGMLALFSLAGRRRRVAALWMLLLAAGLMSGGCGGSPNLDNGGGGTSPTNPADPGTPLGTLTFQVTGAAVDAPITARHTAALSVTVQ